MKRVLFVFFVLFCFITTTYAEINNPKQVLRVFNDAHNEESIEGAVILDDGSFVTVGKYYAKEDGRTDFGIAAGNDTIGIVMRYDKDGNLLWEKTLPNCPSLTDVVLTPDGDILVVGTYTIATLNLDGEIVEHVTNYSAYLQKVVINDDNEIFAVAYDTLLKINENFELVDQKYFGEDLLISDIMIFDDNIILSVRSWANQEYTAPMYRLDYDLNVIWRSLIGPNGSTSVSQIGNQIVMSDSNSISLVNGDGEVQWNKYYTPAGIDWAYFSTVGVSSNNTILLFGEERNNSENIFQIVIVEYDLEGNIIDKKTFFDVPPTITKPDCTYDDTGCACGGIATSQRGFVLTGYTIKKNPNYDPDADDDFDGDYYGYILFNTITKRYNITTETDGNGLVEAVSDAVGGEFITFTITPNEGYELDYVKVTDVKGAVLIFTDNTFKMPSTDVKIEAKFIKKENNNEENNETDTEDGKHSIEEPKNPKTGNFAIVLAFVILLISLLSAAYFKVKKKLKN